MAAVEETTTCAACGMTVAVNKTCRECGALLRQRQLDSAVTATPQPALLTMTAADVLDSDEKALVYLSSLAVRTATGKSQPPYKRSWKSWRARPPPTQVSATQLMGSRAVS
jgi:hypothetical protein